MMRRILTAALCACAGLSSAQTYDVVSIEPRYNGSPEGAVFLNGNSVTAAATAVIVHPTGIHTNSSRAAASTKMFVTFRTYVGLPSPPMAFKRRLKYLIRQSGTLSIATANSTTLGSVSCLSYIGGVNSREILSASWNDYQRTESFVDSPEYPVDVTFYTDGRGYAIGQAWIDMPMVVAQAKAFLSVGVESSSCYVTASNTLSLVMLGASNPKAR